MYERNGCTSPIAHTAITEVGNTGVSTSEQLPKKVFLCHNHPPPSCGTNRAILLPVPNKPPLHLENCDCDQLVGAVERDYCARVDQHYYPPKNTK